MLIFFSFPSVYCLPLAKLIRFLRHSFIISSVINADITESNSIFADTLFNRTLLKRIEVVAAVIEHNGKYFATQRGYGDYKDKWEFPGGKMEKGEISEEALVREIKEELATTISVDKFICTVDCDYAEFHLTMHTFLCHVVSGKLQLLEAEDAQWLDEQHLNTVDWLPADREVIDKIINEE